jgi:Putative helicase
MLANALRILFSFKRPSKRQHGVVRPVGGGDHPSPKSLTPDLIKKLEEGDEDALRYPPYIRGYPAFIAGHVLLDYHKEKVGQIASGIGLPPQQFKRLILPALVSYANFVHLVPASQNHHHRAWGGLLAHGLEVALLALNSCQVTSFDHGRVPQERTRRKERWYAAAVFASLLHDTGKPLSDFRVTDASGELFWKPVSKSIPDWAAENGIERYYLHWNPGRHERHKNLSITMVDRILHPEVREWLMDGGQDLYSAMVAAITGDDEKSALTGIVIKADSASVHLDLKKRGGDPAGTAAGGTGVPIASHVIGAMRLLRQNEVWKANGRGDRIWSTTQGIFIAWNAAAAEVVEKMLADGLKAFPRSADSLGEILADHDVFERNPNGSIYWKVAPDILSEGKEKILRLQCIKLSSPSTLYPYDPAPPPVAVTIGDEKDGVRYDPVNGAMGVPVGAHAQEGALKGVELAGGDHPVATDGDLKPMFDLESASGAVPGKTSSGFAEPSLQPTRGPGKKPAAAPSVTLDATPSKKHGLVIGAPPPATGADGVKTVPPQPRSDLFAGVKVGVSVPALEDEVPHVEPAAEQTDPFATPLAGDPFFVQPTVQYQPTKAVASISSGGTAPAKEKGPTLAGSEPNPGRQHLNERQGTRPTSPALQIGAKPLASEVTTAANTPPQKPNEQIAGERFETIDITSDFDPEILEFTGIDRAFGDVPVKVKKSSHEDPLPGQTVENCPARHEPSFDQDARREASSKVSLVAPPIGDFDDAFRFDAHLAVLEEFDVPELPGENPLGISAPAEFADIDMSSFCVQEVPKPVSLESFDLPALESHVFVGGAPSQPIVQLGGLDDLECADASELGEVDELQEAAGGPFPESTATAQGAKKKRRRRKRHATAIEAIPESDLGQPPLGESGARIHIGPVRKDPVQPVQPRLETLQVEAPPPPSVEVAPVADILPPSDYLAFLNRQPQLAEKFLWYTRHVQRGVMLYKRHQVLFLFQEGGFQPEDEDALIEAHWLWFDITAPGRTVFGQVKRMGFVLVPYLVDALAALSEGGFQIALSRPSTDLSISELARLARTALEGAQVNTTSYGVPVVVFTPNQISAIASEQGVKDLDLIRALIETQETSLDRKKYVIRVDAKAASDE